VREVFVQGRQIRVVIVDDHDLIRQGVSSVLDESFDVVGEASDVEGALDRIRDTHPDVVLIDVNLGHGGHGATVVRKARDEAAFLALSALVEREAVMEMIAAGSSGYITKRDTERLPRAIEMVAAGIPYFSRELALMVRAQPHVSSELAADEKAAMDLVVGGLDPEEVAGQLGISVDRVHEIYQRVIDIARERKG
jgi:two-component system invasion response regulator UvrY